MCAFALHLAFPRTGAWWLIPLALAGLFHTWARLPPWTAALNGFVSGLVFFTLSFSWFGETAGALLGPFAFIIDLGPAVGEAPAFAFAALVTSIAARRSPPVLAPALGAAAFTAAEWMRSSGILAVPFGQLGLPLVDSPLRPLAAFAGGYGLTFAIALVAAYAASAIDRPAARRDLAVAVAAVALLCAGAWFASPARGMALPATRVAAIQGNIAQSIKNSDPARMLAVDRYGTMTAALAPFHPTLVVWPETVILTDMTRDAAARARFGALAQRIGAEIAVGTIVEDSVNRGLYNNAIVFFGPDGSVRSQVTKRQLVPFAEFIPGPGWLRALPFADEIGHFSQGHGPMIDPGTSAGTLICWESMFPDIALEEVRAGAAFFAVATDDAWFGTSDGPYQHAEATTLRAVETGRWIVRAAATGISGIVAPDGDWTQRTELGTQTTVTGEIGPPVTTLYARIGPYPIGLGLLVFALGGLAFRRRSI